MELLPLILLSGGTFLVLLLLILAFAGPSAKKAGSRRLTSLRDRHGKEPPATPEFSLTA